MPHWFGSFRESYEAGKKVFESLGEIFDEKGYDKTLGDEGGFAPSLQSDEEALGLLVSAIERAGFKPGDEIAIALDCAANEFSSLKGQTYRYNFDGEEKNPTSMMQVYSDWINKYPIISIEDPFHEDDWKSWERFTKKFGRKINIVGDDLLVTNPDILERAIDEVAANTILIKPNQIGTLKRTLDAIFMAINNGWDIIISHRSGETMDSFIADLAVATSAAFIKTGAPGPDERVSKYDRLLEIEKELGERAKFLGIDN